MSKNFLEFHNEFREYFNTTAPSKIEDILSLEDRIKVHNKFHNLRIEYIIEFTKRYLATEWNNPHGYIGLDKLDNHAETFVNELFNEYLTNRKKV